MPSTPTSPVVMLALGSNLGERHHNLDQALDLLDSDVLSAMRKSERYESAPMYNEDQPPFLNMAVMGSTVLPPKALLTNLKTIEIDLGRNPNAQRYGPRLIDLDIIYYSDHILEQEDLTIPHPLRLERPFVLRPLLDLDPHWRDPRADITLQQAWERLDTSHPPTLANRVRNP